MRSVDLAIYADALAGEAAAVAARVERARARLRESEIEREARRVQGEPDEHDELPADLRHAGVGQAPSCLTTA